MAGKKTTRQQQKADTTEKIIRSAIKCFGQLGYAGSSVNAIAKEAGVTGGLVIERFGSKEGLLSAAFSYIAEKYLQEKLGSYAADKRLLLVLEKAKEMQKEDPQSFAFLKAALLSCDFPDSFEQQRKEFFEGLALSKEIAIAQERGLLPQVDPWSVFSTFAAVTFCQLDTCERCGISVASGDTFLSAVGFEPRRSVTQKELALQKIMLSYLEHNAEIVSLIDLETGSLEVITSSPSYSAFDQKGTPGNISEVFAGISDWAVPEFREEYTKLMSLEGIKERLESEGSFSAQTFSQDPQGNLIRTLNSFYTVDDEKRYVLAVCENTTEAYEREQAIAQARGGVASYQMPSSEFIENVIDNNDDTKCILVVEDSEINREILQEILSDEYDVLLANNGEEAIRVLREHVGQVDLVLLDVYMPVCNGFQFLERTQIDPVLSQIPVVVATGSDHREDEERCLRLGAIDFVTKPYNPVNLLERVRGAIKLSLSAATLSSFEIDPLTGLYTSQAFSYHAGRKLSEMGASYNLAVVDIRDFAMANSIHGERLGDEALKFVGDQLRVCLPDALISRSGGRFDVLISGSDTLGDMLEHFEEVKESAPIPNLRLQIGVCENISRDMSISAYCDRAKMALQSIENDSMAHIAFYDESLEQKKAHDAMILAGFDTAIAQRQFVAWAQPKVDCVTGRVEAAEALVRWFDGEGNFVSPGDFVPLFEKEGCIKELDEYIFRSVCEYQHARVQAGVRVVPISVNLSRNSLFSAGIVQRYKDIASEAGVDCSLVPIEITESASVSDESIRGICEDFVQAGFGLHLDDFGSGFSSLSSLSSLPFEILKLDKSLVDRIGSPKGEAVIKSAIGVARDLGMRVVAEGAEEKSQIDFLAQSGCRLIQGYFYSPPVKLEAFDKLLDEDAPFAQAVASDAPMTPYPKLHGDDFRRYLKVSRSVFPVVRVFDASCCSYYEVGEYGEAIPQKGKCYEIWGRTSRCENCTSKQAIATKSTLHKFELLNGEAYIVYSKYVEVDGEPRVVELVDKVGSDFVHGLEGTPSFIDAITVPDEELFQDVQLGTLNRRFFEERIGELSGISAVAFADVDNLKGTNDTKGHKGGDELLRTVADVLNHCVRDTDRVIRMGGDEFLLAFAGMREDMLEEKLVSIREAALKAGASISIGGCCCKGVTDEAVKAADNAMYRAKSKGSGVAVARGADSPLA